MKERYELEQLNGSKKIRTVTLVPQRYLLRYHKGGQLTLNRKGDTTCLGGEELQTREVKPDQFGPDQLLPVSVQNKAVYGRRLAFTTHTNGLGPTRLTAIQ